MKKIVLMISFTVLIAGTAYAASTGLYQSLGVKEPFSMFVVGLGMLAAAKIARIEMSRQPEKVKAKRNYQRF